MTADCVYATWFVILKENNLCQCCPSPHAQRRIGDSVCFFVRKADIRFVLAEETMRTWCTEEFCVNIFTWKSFIWQKKKKKNEPTGLFHTKFEKFFLLSLICPATSMSVYWTCEIGPACLADVLFWMGCWAVVCCLSSDTEGAPQLVASI